MCVRMFSIFLLFLREGMSYLVEYLNLFFYLVFLVWKRYYYNSSLRSSSVVPYHYLSYQDIRAS